MRALARLALGVGHVDLEQLGYRLAEGVLAPAVVLDRPPGSIRRAQAAPGPPVVQAGEQPVEDSRSFFLVQLPGQVLVLLVLVDGDQPRDQVHPAPGGIIVADVAQEVAGQVYFAGHPELEVLSPHEPGDHLLAAGQGLDQGLVQPPALAGLAALQEPLPRILATSLGILPCLFLLVNSVSIGTTWP